MESVQGKMTMQWIQERNAEPHGLHDHEQFKTREDFLGFMAQGEQGYRQWVPSLVEAITAPDNPPEIEPLRERARQQMERADDPDMLLTIACAWALSSNPKLETWQRVKKVAYNSWQVANWLSEAMSALAQNDAEVRKVYISLSIRLFEALDRGDLKSESQQKNNEREGALQDWLRAKYKLEELWWGLRTSHFMYYEEEIRIFGLLNELSSDDFQRLIASSNNPFLVNAALLGAGVWAFNPRFSQWEICAKMAPSAFDPDGSWRGSPVLPLLLVHARNELLAPTRQVPRQGADEDEVATLTAQVTELVQVVVDILSSRNDAPATFARWSAWLMHELLRHEESNFTDIRSYSFVDNALLEAIGKAMRGKSLPLNMSNDVAPWEAWCHHCVMSSFAYDGFIDVPSFKEFADQWQLSPENWHEPRGRQLLERADLHLIGNNGMPGLSANLLAFPLASKDDFAQGWQQLWDSTYHLREVLEFGSADAGEDSYADRGNASRLLLLLGCMGLACFDQIGARLEASPDQQMTMELISLYKALSSAAMEVLHLDNTLNRDKWRAFLQHLALRRVYWDGNYTAEQRFALFPTQQEPTIRDYLNYFQADPGELVTFLHACMLNQLDPLGLRNELREASVDLRACVAMLKRLHELRENRYPVNDRAISLIEPLMERNA
ncbi:hypothetical protein [Burkholderia ubonensis]|uniref:hypothetical protein n=1 Tax=Burkholderia ubonensis TaxID=101571 RepID=UPI00076D5331|nr:hypothetical protein [Burkholderia ubonensis]KWN73893.1 hypothetical protein WM24_32850 [Burkholderia ubonensis]